MLLFIASACPVTISAMGKLFSCRVTRSENSAKVWCVICWSNRSGWNSRFLANLLDGNVLFVLKNRNVCPLLFTQSARKNHAWKMNFANLLDWPLQSSKTYHCCCVFKRKPDPWAFVGSNIELGEGVFFPSFGVVLEIVLLRRKVDMMGKTFSSSFVRACIWLGKVICSLKRSQISLFFINVVHLVQVDN